jgi:hypothetical protein
MKALSFRQPWAELILQGCKTMDLRTYNTHHRGPLAIHASKTVERDACQEQGLDPDALDRGGVVGVAELVDVVPLTEADYEEHRDEHLAGRSYREGMYGWVLADPQRLPQVVPTRGRMSLFNVDLSAEGQAAPAAEVRARASKRAPALYQASAAGGGPERPFTLHVQPIAGNSTSYALILEQRVLEPVSGREGEPSMTQVVTLGGDNLRAVANHVIEALRQAEYKATDLSPERRAPFYLPEAVGVRLGLAFLAVKPLSKYKRVEAISHGIRQMPLEEAYYWYSKCTDTSTADRAQRALRILLAEE